MIPIRSLVLFSMALVQDQEEPTYHGKSVRLGDAGLVLLRWKTAENQHCVICGDLRATTGSTEDLENSDALPSR
jgi:hypothetical protein